MAKLTAQQWQEISPLLDQALDLSATEREAWLQSLTRSKPEWIDLLRLLLDEHRAVVAERFLEFSPHSPGAAADLQGQRVGPYTLISPIGTGGMGRVWLAERSDGSFERRVAVKFLQFSVSSRAGAERFKREGRILGSLSHPHIAELIDAGVMPDGQPYMVLEYVEGEPIDQYCLSRSLDLRARIQLFLDVLAALSVAHAHLIVHRDIKPSNVLVDAQGQVKLLDFGIAKLLAQDATSPATLLTLEGGAALTPYFAAPEQVTAGAITTATDIYAAGVLLYLLLAGRHPLGPASHSTAELVKRIVEIEPARPSDEISLAGPDGAAAPAEGAMSSSHAAHLRRQLRGDLDTIVMRALKKSPGERYSSIAAFADDLRAYLNHQPISARPDTLAYRAAKFVRRNRLAVTLASLALLAMIAGLVGTLFQARNARVQRDAALRERDRANRITEFMTNMFRVSDPSEARGNSITAREILDKASSEIDPGLAKDPALQVQMMTVMGDVYDDLGLYPNAESLLRRAVAIQSASRAPNDAQSLKSQRLLGRVLQEEGRYSDAEKLERATLEQDRRLLGAANPETLTLSDNLATTLYVEGRLAESENLHRQTLDTERRVLGPSDAITLSSMNNLAVTLYYEGRYPESEKLQREALDTETRVLGPENPLTLAIADNLALSLCGEGRYAEAESIGRNSLKSELRILGPDHPQTLRSMANVGLYLKHQGHYAEAEKLIRQALAIDLRIFGPDHAQTAECIYNLGCIAALEGKRDQALALIRQAVGHGLIPVFSFHTVEDDPDLKSLHGDPRFDAVIALAKQRAAAQASH